MEAVVPLLVVPQTGQDNRYVSDKLCLHVHLAVCMFACLHVCMFALTLVVYNPSASSCWLNHPLCSPTACLPACLPLLPLLPAAPAASASAACRFAAVCVCCLQAVCCCCRCLPPAGAAGSQASTQEVCGNTGTAG